MYAWRGLDPRRIASLARAVRGAVRAPGPAEERPSASGGDGPPSAVSEPTAAPAKAQASTAR